MTWILTRNTSRRHSKNWVIPRYPTRSCHPGRISKEVMAVSKYFQHQTSLLTSSAIPQVLHICLAKHCMGLHALPKWINNYHCLGLQKNACGPLLSRCCAMWCDDTRLREELIECNIGSFVQVHIETFFSDLVRIDLQAALQRSIDTLHLPVKRLQDNQVMMKVFVPHGVTCFSSHLCMYLLI